MHVAVKGTADPTVSEGARRSHLLAQQADRQLWRLQRSPRTPWRSPARLGSISAEAINQSSADVVNLHWVTDGFLSVETIGRIEKPIVWSMYDMWPFTGTEHYDAIPQRWQDGYDSTNRPPDESGFDLDRWTFQRKQRQWTSRSNFHMVPASSWLEEAVRGSSLLGETHVTRIPHVVDTETFSPLSKHDARTHLGLAESPTILFIASAGIADQRKGGDLLLQAIPQMRATSPTVQLVVVGPSPEASVRADVEDKLGSPIQWYGSTSQSTQLHALYAAADVVAVPSREDNMPLVAMEAQTVGRPVVAFRIGGLPDIVNHAETGYLAESFDAADLAHGLTEFLDRALGSDEIDRAARQRALDTWSPDVVVSRYREVYEEVLA